MKKKLIVLLAFLTLTMTGCTSYLKDDSKKIVKNEVTGQNIVKNILCQPTDENTLKVYKNYKIKIDNIPSCDKFKITSGGYEGIWNTIFVKPLAWIILKVGYLIKNFGLAIILVTLLIRLIMYPMTNKAAKQSELIKKVQPELNKLEKKYAGKTDQESMMQKSQEMMMIYKKNNISPLSGCLFSFIQLPLFMAFYEALYRLPAIFEGKFLNLDLGLTPLIALQSGKWYYIIQVVLVFIVTFYSFKLNAGASLGKEQEVQMKTMRNVTLVMIGFASLSVSTAISLYWITNSTFTIIQNLIVKRSKAL